MKVTASTAAAILAVARVTAQNAPGYVSASAPGYSEVPVSYTTITVDSCETASLETMITVTNGFTVTYCPECDQGQITPTARPSPTGPGYTTTYTTTYLSLCPTGVTTATYTVTESCTDDEPTWTPGPSHIPDGFTITEKECTICGKETPTVTVTEPCGCEATGGVPVPPKNTPVQQIPDGQVQNPKPGNNGSPNGDSPAPTQPACNGANCGGSGNQSPSTPGGGSNATPAACNGEDCGGSGNQSPSPPAGDSPNAPAGGSPNAPAGASPNAPAYPATSVQCPGPECRAKATQTPVPGVPNGNSNTTTPYEGAASSSHIGPAASVIFSAIVGGLACLL